MEFRMESFENTSQEGLRRYEMTKMVKNDDVRWTTELKIRDPKEYNFYYYYSLKDRLTNTNIWERQSQRAFDFKNDKKQLIQGKITTNDGIFNPEFFVNKIGRGFRDVGLYIGNYPTTKMELQKISRAGANVVLNLQSFKEKVKNDKLFP